MSLIKKTLEAEKKNKKIINFMGGESYQINRLDTL